MKLPEFNKTRSSRKILLLCAALVAIVMTLAIAKLSCMRHSSKFNASSLPPGVQVISEKIDQSGPYPKIETIVIADNYVQADEIEELLKNIYEYQKDRTDFAGNKKTGAIAVYTYASQAIYSSDPDWWIGRLLWDKENPDPQINTNLDALLPRQEETGSGGLSRNDYLAQSDDIAVKLIAIMKQLQKDFRDFEKLTMNQDDFRAKAEKASDDIYELTKTLPDPPIKDCADLDKAFLGLVQETQYFEEIFAPGSNVFVENRLNTEEFYDKLNSFAAAEGIYNAEREKLKNK